MRSDQDNLIRSARIDAGLTQIQAAQRIGWSQAAWAQLESGDPDRHSLGRYRRVAEALECDLQVILKPRRQRG